VAHAKQDCPSKSSPTVARCSRIGSDRESWKDGTSIAPPRCQTARSAPKTRETTAKVSLKAPGSGRTKGPIAGFDGGSGRRVAKRGHWAAERGSRGPVRERRKCHVRSDGASLSVSSRSAREWGRVLLWAPDRPTSLLFQHRAEIMAPKKSAAKKAVAKEVSTPCAPTSHRQGLHAGYSSPMPLFIREIAAAVERVGEIAQRVAEGTTKPLPTRWTASVSLPDACIDRVFPPSVYFPYKNLI